MQTPERRHQRLTDSLGLASLALAAPALMAPGRVARLTGTDRQPMAEGLIRAVGAREVLHGALLLAGSRRMVWTRVIGDGADLALLGRALRDARGARARRAGVATAAVAGIAALDLYATARVLRSQHGRGRPGPLELNASVTVNREPAEVYAFWRQVENLPRFMLHLESVTDLGDGRSRWTAHAPFGRTVSWEAEVTSEEEDRRIAWKSLPGADVANSGTVHFSPAPGDRGTEVHVVLHYDIPGGRAGRAAAKLLGEEPGQQVRDDLRRLKQVLETGDVVRSEALPHGTDARHQFLQRPARALAEAAGSAR